MNEIGKYFWLRDEEFEWLPAKIIGINNNKYIFSVQKNNYTEQLEDDKDKDYVEVDPSCISGVDDLLLLGDFNKQTLLHNTRERFNNDKIYSFIGSPILIAVNPYKDLPIYDSKTIRFYKDYFKQMKKDLNSLPPPKPHLFHLAEAAYEDMINEKSNQCIIICGESGSGKTQSTKLILKYLAVSSEQTEKNIENNEITVEKQVLDSNPLLEAFGNAKTVRNNNSSRFGKFIQVNFTDNGKIISARIYNYLLEKSRIVKIQKEERNYHIFYQIIKGADDYERKKFYIRDLEYFNYLNTGSFVIDDSDDKENFIETKESMIKLKFSTQEMCLIFNVIMGILYLGNIKFQEVLKNGDLCSEVDDNCNDDFMVCSELLGLNQETLNNLLTKRKMKDSLSQKYIERNLSVDSALKARDAMAKAIYSKMFDWIIRRVNTAISNTDKEKTIPKEKIRYIGLLDIFGFENFETNSFEQLCINYANERLQQFFNNHIFKIEQQEYQKENIDWSNVEFTDNIKIVDLIDNPKLSIFSLLDSESLMRNCNDYTFQSKVYSNLVEVNEYLGENIDGYLSIYHYAGDVFYDVEGFIEKNNDNVSIDITEALMNSKNKLVGKIFSPSKSDKPKRQSSSVNKIQSDSLSKQFKKQLDELIFMLNQSNPRYIKCIKPNSIKKPVVFESCDVVEQLLSAGVLEAIKIRKQGYSIRRNLKEFIDRYNLLTPELNIKSYENLKEGYMRMCQDMFKLLKNVKDLEDYFDNSSKKIQIGVTKVFMKEEVKNELEFKLNRMKYIIRIQGYFRIYKNTKFIKKLRKNIQLIRAVWLGNKYYKYFKKVRSSIKIQNSFRHYKMKLLIYQKLKRLAIEAIKKKNNIQKEKLSSLPPIEEKPNLNSNNITLNESKIEVIEGRSTFSSSKNYKTLIEGLSLTDKKFRKKNTFMDLTTKKMDSVLESELVLKIQSLNEEIKMLKNDKEQLNQTIIRYKDTLDNKDRQVDITEEKLKVMKEVLVKCEEDNKKLQTKLSLSSVVEDFEKIKEDLNNSKKINNNLESQIEILNLKVEELTKMNISLNSTVDSLKDQLKKRKEKFDIEIQSALEKISSIEKDKMEIDRKYNETLSIYNTNNDKISNTNEKDYLEYKKQINQLKKENSNITKKYDEYKSNMNYEMTKLKTDLSMREGKINEFNNVISKLENELNSANNKYKDLNDFNTKLKDSIKEQQIKINLLESKESRFEESLKIELENIIRKKDKEISDLKENMDTNNQIADRAKKLELALKNELKLKENEIMKRTEIINELQIEMDKNSDENIILKKENFSLKSKVDLMEKEFVSKYENQIQNKNKEIFILKEKISTYEKLFEDNKSLINKKQLIIDNKKQVNLILVDIIKLKRSEVQCVEAMNFTDSITIKENLNNIRLSEKDLMEKLEELTTNLDIMTDSDEEDYESDSGYLS